MKDQSRKSPVRHYQIADYLMMLDQGASSPLPAPTEDSSGSIRGRTTIRKALTISCTGGLQHRKPGQGDILDRKTVTRKGKAFGINREIFRITQKTEVVLSKEITAPGISPLGIPAGSRIVMFKGCGCR